MEGPWFANTLRIIETYHWLPTSKSDQEIGCFDGFFVGSLISLLNKQSMCVWLEMPWHACDVAAIHLNARIYASKDMRDILNDMFRMNR